MAFDDFNSEVEWYLASNKETNIHLADKEIDRKRANSRSSFKVLAGDGTLQ